MSSTPRASPSLLEPDGVHCASCSAQHSWRVSATAHWQGLRRSVNRLAMHKGVASLTATPPTGHRSIRWAAGLDFFETKVAFAGAFAKLVLGSALQALAGFPMEHAALLDQAQFLRAVLPPSALGTKYVSIAARLEAARWSSTVVSSTSSPSRGVQIRRARPTPMSRPPG